jgi:hypothetical protein
VPSEVAITPRCVECSEVWLPADPERWKLLFDVDDDLVWFCPECHQHEFGDT